MIWFPEGLKFMAQLSCLNCFLWGGGGEGIIKIRLMMSRGGC